MHTIYSYTFNIIQNSLFFSIIYSPLSHDHIPNQRYVIFRKLLTVKINLSCILLTLKHNSCHDTWVPLPSFPLVVTAHLRKVKLFSTLSRHWTCQHLVACSSFHLKAPARFENEWVHIEQGDTVVVFYLHIILLFKKSVSLFYLFFVLFFYSK